MMYHGCNLNVNFKPKKYGLYRVDRVELNSSYCYLVSLYCIVARAVVLRFLVKRCGAGSPCAAQYNCYNFRNALRKIIESISIQILCMNAKGAVEQEEAGEHNNAVQPRTAWGS